MVKCKNCNSEEIVKAGKIRSKQRFKCKECGYHFVVGDSRTKEKIAAKKALCVLLYSLGKATFRMLAKIFDTHPSLIYRWIVEAGAKLPEQTIDSEITEVEFDEMWHFLKNKKTNFGSLKQLNAVQGELLPGYSVVVILKRSKDYMIN